MNNSKINQNHTITDSQNTAQPSGTFGPTARLRGSRVRYIPTSVVPEAKWQGVHYLNVEVIWCVTARPEIPEPDWEKVDKQTNRRSKRTGEWIYPPEVYRYQRDLAWACYFTEHEVVCLSHYLLKTYGQLVQVTPQHIPRPALMASLDDLLPLYEFGEVRLPKGRPDGIDGVVIGYFNPAVPKRVRKASRRPSRP